MATEEEAMEALQASGEMAQVSLDSVVDSRLLEYFLLLVSSCFFVLPFLLLLLLSSSSSFFSFLLLLSFSFVLFFVNQCFLIKT